MFFRTENLPSFEYFRVQPIMLRLLGVCLFVVVVVYGVDEHAFDCTRPDDQCLFGGTCVPGGTAVAPGTCSCVSPYQNFNCGDDSTTNAASNTCNCANGGTCKQDGSCLCPETHYGTTCQLKTIQALCSVTDKILINVNIPNDANVIVYPTGKRATCTFGPPSGTNIPADWSGKAQEISIPNDPDCGDPVQETDSNGAVGYCTEVIIRHQDAFVTTRDSKAKFCCKDGQVTITIAKITATETGIRQKIVNQPDANAGLITGILTDGTTEIPDDTQKNLGDRVDLKFTLSSDPAVQAFRVLECRATSFDPAGSGPGTSVTFLEDSCPVTGSQIIKGTSSNSATEIAIRTEVVKLDASDKVYYTCDIRLCIDVTRCQGVVCPDGTTHFGRRKREASDASNSTSQITRTMVISVKDPFIKSEVKKAVKEGIAENSQVNMTAAVIGLAVVVLVLLAMCLVLGLCLINKRAPRPEKQIQG